MLGDWLGIGVPVVGGESLTAFSSLVFKSFVHLANCLYLDP